MSEPTVPSRPAAASPVARRLDLRVLYLGLVFLHGAFASGMVPVLNRQLGARAAYAFALYFAGMVAAQAAIRLFAPLSRFRGALAAYEALFAAALVYMAVSMSPLGFLSGRLVEGLGSGLTLPLLFAGVQRLAHWGSPEMRIAWLNSMFAVGFVAGPFVVELAAKFAPTRPLLLAFAVAFLVMAAALRLRPEPAAVHVEDGWRPPSGVARFYPLFVAKIIYGFLLSFLGSHADAAFSGVPISLVMLALAVIFVLGQGLTAAGVRRLGTRPLLRVAPLAMAIAAGAMAVTGVEALFFVVAATHSVLVLIGYRMFAGGPDDARTFALFNLMTDPGLVLGALLASLGTVGAGGLAAAGLVSLWLPAPDAAPPRRSA